jgi:hypothetical protein
VTDHTDEFSRQDFEHSIPLDLSINLEDSARPFVYALADAMIQHHNVRRNVRTLDQARNSVGTVLANLKRAYDQDPALFVAVSLNSNNYRVTSRYNPQGIGYENLRRTVEYFRDQTPALTTYHRGVLFEGFARFSRIRCTPSLVHLMRDQGIGMGRGEASPLSVVYSGRFEPIRLKNERKRLIDYEDDPATERMRGRVQEWNAFLDDHIVDIFLSDAQFENLFSGEQADDAEEGEDDPQPRASLDFTRRHLYRVFNNGSFDFGGRFYGGWWQDVPSRWRSHITIDNVPTRELDFSNMQAAMLYAIEGERLETDAYSLEGVDRSYRKLIKKTFFQLINARDGRIRAPNPESLPPNWTWRQLRDAVATKHAAISRHFNTGIGVRLQRLDADIAERVLLGMRAQGEIALPIHDSFIASRWVYETLQHTMATSYREAMGDDIGIEVEPGFADHLLENIQPEPGDEFDEEIIDRWESFATAPGYEGYFRRLETFLSRKTPEFIAEFTGRSVS